MMVEILFVTLFVNTIMATLSTEQAKLLKKKHYDEGELGASFWVEEEDGELFSRGDEWD